jgi:hypothetical protein
MNKAVVSASFLFCMISITSHAPAQSERKNARIHDKTGEDVSLFVFRKVLPIISRESKIPPMLPGILPGVNSSHPVYALSPIVGKNGYQVTLVTELPCEGQHQCLYGIVRGGESSSMDSDADSEAKRTRVKLHDGVLGWITDAECGAYCDQSTIEWMLNGRYYSISLNAGTDSDLIAAANSAIKGGIRRHIAWSLRNHRERRKASV